MLLITLSPYFQENYVGEGDERRALKAALHTQSVKLLIHTVFFVSTNIVIVSPSGQDHKIGVKHLF